MVFLRLSPLLLYIAIGTAFSLRPSVRRHNSLQRKGISTQVVQVGSSDTRTLTQRILEALPLEVTAGGAGGAVEVMLSTISPFH